MSTMTLERVKPVLPSEAEMVQVELRPHAREPTLPPLPKPYVCCPLTMTVRMRLHRKYPISSIPR